MEVPARFDHEIVPLLHERWRYAGAADFLLYDVVTDGGGVADDVFAYSNGRGADRSLVIYHNKFGSTSGWIRQSVPFAVERPVWSDAPGFAVAEHVHATTLDVGKGADPIAIVSNRLAQNEGEWQPFKPSGLMARLARPVG